MSVEKILYFMLALFENDDVIISYKLVIFGVVKYARISLIDHLFFCFGITTLKNHASARSQRRLKDDSSSGFIQILFPVQSLMYPG